LERPLIAVIGDAGKAKQPELAKKAAEDLGSELAKRGFRMLVYSNKADFIEWHAVQGYLRSNTKKESRSIEVRYPPNLDGRFPGEKEDDPVFVRTQLGDDWEASFYPSFADIDALILIGGGQTTRIAGLLALGSKTPVLALAGLGGAAYEIWSQLGANNNATVTRDDLNVMANQMWTEKSAERSVDALVAQLRRKEELAKQAILGASEKRRKRVLTLLAVLGSGLFVIVLLALVESLTSGSLSRSFLWMLFGTPAIAGASGAAIRVLWDNWEQRAVPLELRPVTMTIALGFWASGVAGALFLLPQIWVLGSSLNPMQGGKLAGFAVPIGLLAGLTLDKVFPKLIKYDVPVKPITTAPASSP
jgi:hypothetical protein